MAKQIKMLINTDDKQGHINREIYGNFSEHLGRCIYNGLYVGEDSDIPNIHGLRKDIIDALKNIKLPVLRWPGGCFADEYHWKDGIGDKNDRKKIINTNWSESLRTTALVPMSSWNSVNWLDVNHISRAMWAVGL